LKEIFINKFQNCHIFCFSLLWNHY